MLIHSPLGKMDLSLNNVISPDGTVYCCHVLHCFHLPPELKLKLEKFKLMQMFSTEPSYNKIFSTNIQQLHYREKELK